MKSVLVPYHLAQPLPRLADAFAADDAIVVAKGPAGPTVTRIFEQLASRIAALVEPALVLSGDCATALATVAGLQRRGLAPGIVWLDAHADFYTPRTTRSGDLHRMALAMLVGRAGNALHDAVELRTVDEDAVVLAGARSIDEVEREALDASPIRRVALATLAGAPLPPPPWYVHLDVDVLVPGELPALRDPAPDGPSAVDVAAALRALAARGEIAALGVACTFTAQGLAERDPLAAVRPLIEAALGVP